MTARIGTPKTGGRKRGSIDREERKLLTDRMSADLMFCYSKLGGRNWLLEYAKANPKEFIQFGLSRLWPAPQKEEESGSTYNTQINNYADERGVAQRVAFALSLGMNAQQELAPVTEITQQAYVNPNDLWQPPTDAPDMPDPDKQRWASELPMTEDQRRDAALVRQTKEARLENYSGSPGSGEQGGNAVQHQPVVNRKPSAAELCRRLSRRGRDLI